MDKLLTTPGLVRAYMQQINPEGANPISDNDLCWFNCLYNAILDGDMSTKDVAKLYKDGIQSMYTLDSLQQTLQCQFEMVEDDVVGIARTDIQLRIEIARMLNPKLVPELKVRLEQIQQGEVV